jgi:hypothetical protein
MHVSSPFASPRRDVGNRCADNGAQAASNPHKRPFDAVSKHGEPDAAEDANDRHESPTAAVSLGACNSDADADRRVHNSTKQTDTGRREPAALTQIFVLEVGGWGAEHRQCHTNSGQHQEASTHDRRDGGWRLIPFGQRYEPARLLKAPTEHDKHRRKHRSDDKDDPPCPQAKTGNGK